MQPRARPGLCPKPPPENSNNQTQHTCQSKLKSSPVKHIRWTARIGAVLTPHRWHKGITACTTARAICPSPRMAMGCSLSVCSRDDWELLLVVAAPCASCCKPYGTTAPHPPNALGTTLHRQVQAKTPPRWPQNTSVYVRRCVSTAHTVWGSDIANYARTMMSTSGIRSPRHSPRHYTCPPRQRRAFRGGS